MRKRMRGRLVTAIIAAGLVGGLALGNPSALADPDVPPPPPAPIDPAAAPAPPPADPLCVPPPADPLAPPPADPLAVPPPADPAAPPAPPPFAPPDPLLPPPAAPPTVIPEGTPAGQNPTPYIGRAGVRAADIQPDERLQGRSRQADLHQLRATDRRPGDGRAGDPHLFGPAGARPVLLDQRHPGALAAAGLLAGRHGRQHRRQRHQVELHRSRAAGGHHR